MRIVIITTVPATMAYFMAEHIRALKARGHELHLVCGPDTWVRAEDLTQKFDTPVHVVNLLRRIAPVSDIIALIRLWALLYKLRPHIVHYSTPKAALVGALASWVARVPRRVYTMRGLLAADSPGLKGAAWRAVEWLICALSHSVTINSRSNCEFAIARGICPAAKAIVIGKGSSHGVDAAERFNLETLSSRSYPDSLREPSKIVAAHFTDNAGPDTATPVTFLFIGRIAADKGFAELSVAWKQARVSVPGARLIIVGPESEPWNAVAAQQIAALKADPAVLCTGAREDVERWYALSDIVVLPSYREGFPNVPLEAAAMERPVITTDALGCVDSVLDGETGIIVPARNANALADAMIRLARDPAMRARMGKAGRVRVLRDFIPENIAAQFADLLISSDLT